MSLSSSIVFICMFFLHRKDIHHSYPKWCTHQNNQNILGKAHVFCAMSPEGKVTVCAKKRVWAHDVKTVVKSVLLICECQCPSNHLQMGGL